MRHLPRDIGPGDGRRIQTFQCRHCRLFHSNLLEDFKLREALVVDGFETFEYSPYYPFHINFAVGAKSWFIYHLTDAPLRRLFPGRTKLAPAWADTYWRRIKTAVYEDRQAAHTCRYAA